MTRLIRRYGDSMEDKEIIKLLERRSETAIEELSNQYKHYCMKIALNILKNIEDVKECINDTWLSVWNQIPPDKPENLSAYVGRITRNKAIDRYHYNHAQKLNIEIVSIFQELDELCSSQGIEMERNEAYLINLFNRFLEKEKKINRIIFVQRYWYANSITTIAENNNISESKAKSILFRMRNRLRSFLEKEGICL